MKNQFSIPYNKQYVDVNVINETSFIVHLSSQPLHLYINKDSRNRKCWKELPVGETPLAVELGILIEKWYHPLWKKIATHHP